MVTLRNFKVSVGTSLGSARTVPAQLLTQIAMGDAVLVLGGNSWLPMSVPTCSPVLDEIRTHHAIGLSNTGAGIWTKVAGSCPRSSSVL